MNGVESIGIGVGSGVMPAPSSGLISFSTLSSRAPSGAARPIGTPKIKKIDGRSARYSLAELVAICVIERATEGLGVTISQIAKSADWLFAEIDSRLQNEPDGSMICFLSDGTAVWSSNLPSEVYAATVIRIGPILDQIRLAPQRLAETKAQLALPL
jgi:hypothetical protein